MSSKHHSVVILTNIDEKHFFVQAVAANVLTRPHFGLLDSSSFKKKIHPNGLLCLWHPNDSLHRHKGLLTTSNLISELGPETAWPKTSTCIYLMPRVNPGLGKHMRKCNPFKPYGKKKPINLLSYTLFQSLSRETKISVSATVLHTRSLWGRRWKQTKKKPTNKKRTFCW